MRDPTPEFLLVLTTSDSHERLRQIGRQLVEQRLAACIQVSGPIESQYWWEGKVATSTEWVCAAKTTQAAWPRVREAILKMHNYETPEIVALPIWDGSPSYLRWIAESVSS